MSNRLKSAWAWVLRWGSFGAAVVAIFVGFVYLITALINTSLGLSGPDRISPLQVAAFVGLLAISSIIESSFRKS